jgi:hypothetical protein
MIPFAQRFSGFRSTAEWGADESCNRTTSSNNKTTRRCVGHSGSCRNQLRRYNFQPTTRPFQSHREILRVARRRTRISNPDSKARPARPARRRARRMVRPTGKRPWFDLLTGLPFEKFADRKTRTLVRADVVDFQNIRMIQGCNGSASSSKRHNRSASLTSVSGSTSIATSRTSHTPRAITSPISFAPRGDWISQSQVS